MAPLPALQSRSLGRILTPEWAKLLSLSAADWQQLLQEHRQAQAAQQGGAEAAGDAPAVGDAPAADAPAAVEAAAAHARPPSGLGGRRRGGRKRGPLTPTHSGVEGMEGVEMEAAP